MLAKMLKLAGAIGFLVATLIFTFVAMMLSGGMGGLPGHWIMDMSNNPILILIGLAVFFVTALGSVGVFLLLAIASMDGCAQSFKWAFGGPRPSINQCFNTMFNAY